ncbi:hypothetical protein CWE09_11255 [Aliidiomarina minuta]|uniref:Uncharacterized protein YyaB-like PH domain-containing protein n=1 Tax=Aliidiomarina minuta TaxID=880057 RepID=A0A432W4J9_9GAMM|nr:PH domain-containing protein [Aliidiomarina minuta]RUO24433.1 hypothetical protein CWE09_11255 [Aliidiomarina minuta]
MRVQGLDKIHSSRVDNWFLLLVVAVAIFSLLAATLLSLRGLSLLGLILLLLGAVLPMWVVMSTRYHITEEDLLVRAGPFRWRLALSSISKIEPCHNGVIAPALSRERIKITYQGSNSLMVSPSDRYSFIMDLGVAEPDVD